MIFDTKLPSFLLSHPPFGVPIVTVEGYQGAGACQEDSADSSSRRTFLITFQAIANLADKSDGGKIHVVIDGQYAAGYDPNWLRNAVEEPLDEANIDGLKIE